MHRLLHSVYIVFVNLLVPIRFDSMVHYSPSWFRDAVIVSSVGFHSDTWSQSQRCARRAWEIVGVTNYISKYYYHDVTRMALLIHILFADVNSDHYYYII